jgi:RNA polymerase sigma-70 factor (ECF subfamily)
MIEEETATTEDQIVRRCQTGDREAFRNLVDHYQNVLYGTAYMMTNNRTVAEDQVQETLLSAWKAIGSFRSGHPFKPWLVRILVNKVVSYQRANSKTMESVDSNQVTDPVGDDPAGDIKREDQLQRVLQSLSQEQRQVVLLRYFAGLSLAETAAVLGRRQGTVKSQVHIALEQLKEFIEDDNQL